MGSEQVGLFRDDEIDDLGPELVTVPAYCPRCGKYSRLVKVEAHLRHRKVRIFCCDCNDLAERGHMI
jgi:hypothetical protein